MVRAQGLQAFLISSHTPGHLLRSAPAVVSMCPHTAVEPMRKRHLRIAILLIVVAFGAAVWWFLSGDSTAADEAAQSDIDGDAVMLSGRIFNASGRPLSGADIFAGESATRSDDQGRFVFFELSAGQTPIDATADGHLRAGVDALGRPIVDLEKDEPVEELELYLPRAASALGRVVAGGDPVENAEVSLSYVFAEGLEGEEIEPFIVSDVVRSDGDGHFEIDELAPGRLQVMVDAEDHDFAESEEMYFRPGQRRTGLVIDVAPAGVLTGHVVDGEGNPLEADVMVEPDHPGRSTQRLGTDDDGYFIFRGLDAGTYSIRAEADDRRPETLDGVEVQADDITEVELVVQGSRGIFGRVQEPDGTAVSGARVDVESTDGEERHRMSTDGGGRFEWPEAPPGDWTAIAASPRHDTSERKPARHDEEVILELTPGGAVSGYVTDSDGEPVTRFHVAISSVDLDGDEPAPFHTRRRPSEDFLSNSGHFELGPLQTGLYQLIVTADGHPAKVTDAIRVSPAQIAGPIDVQLEGGSSLSGTVRDLETDEPVEGATIAYTLRTPDNRPPTTQSDAQGHYELNNIPSGRATLRVTHNEYIHEYIGGVTIPKNGHLDRDIDLEPVGDGPTGQSFQGIGASLRPADNGFEVVGTREGSPAEQMGIREGDIITGVDGSEVNGMTVSQVVEYIRGEPGTGVSLEVHRAGRGSRTIDVERERIFMPQQRRVRPRE